MPTFGQMFVILVLFVLASALVLVLAARLHALQLRLQDCETQLTAIDRTERLTPARLAELAQVKDAVERAEDLLARVNRREIANAKRRDADGTFTTTAAGNKDALRRIAGLRAGQPANHQ